MAEEGCWKCTFHTMHWGGGELRVTALELMRRVCARSKKGSWEEEEDEEEGEEEEEVWVRLERQKGAASTLQGL